MKTRAPEVVRWGHVSCWIHPTELQLLHTASDRAYEQASTWQEWGDALRLDTLINRISSAWEART